MIPQTDVPLSIGPGEPYQAVLIARHAFNYPKPPERRKSVDMVYLTIYGAHGAVQG
jgi:hypothetical protein